MNKSSNGQFKQRRVRLRPIKKWSAAEEKALIEYLLNNPEMEKPTTQIYYRRFCEESNFNISWKTVRTKVKNMRYGYFRAKSWENGEEAVALNKEEIEKNVLRKCSNYYDLEPIFGHRYLECPIQEQSFGASNNDTQYNSIIIDSDDTSQISDYKQPSHSRASDQEMVETRPELVDMKFQRSDKDFGNKCEEMGLRQSELSFKDKITLMELMLKEKKFELKQKRMISKEKIKIYSIQSQEKILLQELQLRERLAKEELMLKYK